MAAHDRALYPVSAISERRGPEVVGVVEAVEGPAIKLGVVLPLGETGVARLQAGASARRGMPSSNRIDAMITPAWHTATTVCPSYSLASRSRSWPTRS